MKRFLCLSLVLGTCVLLGSFFVRPFERAFEEVPAHADGGRGQGAGVVVVSGNGDVNGDNGLDLSDAIYLLAHLFQGGPAPEVCPGGGGNCAGCQADLETCEEDLLACRNATPEDCGPPFGVGVDEDLDCLTDCDDPDCFTEIDCTMGTATFTLIGTNPTTGLQEYREDETLIEFVLLPGGTFDMGSPVTEDNRNDDMRNEGDVHAVTLDAFLMSKTEVTEEEWDRVINPPGVSTSKLPKQQVSWTTLNQSGGFLLTTGLLLPTEAQWEYAARGGTSTAFSWGDDCNVVGCTTCPPPSVDVDSFMWWCANSGITSQPVMGKTANDFGLFDMHGNVWEWCREEFGSYALSVNPGDGERQIPPPGPGERVVRGGNYEEFAAGCRSARRNAVEPNFIGPGVGFRLAAPAP